MTRPTSVVLATGYGGNCVLPARSLSSLFVRLDGEIEFRYQATRPKHLFRFKNVRVRTNILCRRVLNVLMYAQISFFDLETSYGLRETLEFA